MVDIVREVHVDCIGVDVGVFVGVDPCEVLVLEEDWALRQRHWSEGETALKVLVGRWMVEVDGVSFENVVAVCCGGIDVFVKCTGVERGVVEVANGEGDCICNQWL